MQITTLWLAVVVVCRQALSNRVRHTAGSFASAATATRIALPEVDQLPALIEAELRELGRVATRDGAGDARVTSTATSTAPSKRS